MISKRYTEEFKVEAVKQVTERGYPLAEVAGRLGVSQHSLYQWLKGYGQPGEVRQEQQSQSAEIRRLKAELKRGGFKFQVQQVDDDVRRSRTTLG